jgi:hypothetical protein
MASRWRWTSLGSRARLPGESTRGGCLDAVFFDGLDEALLGFMDRFGPQGHYTVPIYDRAKCIAILASQFPGTEDERHAAAVEWMDYNVQGAYLGEGTPGFLTY